MAGKDTSHPNFNIPAKKIKKKSTWCNGFILLDARSDMDNVERERRNRVKDYLHRLIKAKY